ncbi:MAG TPA: O-antigen ligase family protein [Gemmataceae bacterium]|nr:O-antigen ligase family protein [Gemmataceae bacterium]
MIWLLGVYMWLFVHRPFEIWPVLGDLQIERIYMLLMIAYWAVQPNKGWINNRLHVALVAFTLAMTAAWLASPYMSNEGCPDIVEDYFKYLVFYILVVTSVRDEDGLRKLFSLYLLAVTLYTGHSLLEYLGGRYQWRMGVARMLGVNTTIGDANGFAANLVYSLPLTVPFWLTRPSGWMRAALVGFTLLAVGCILLTGSRAGLLSLGLCTLLCLAATGRVKLVALLIVLGLLAAPVVWFSLPQDLRTRYETIIDPSVGPKNAQESASGRLDGLIYGFEAWQQSPLLGYGPGGFKYVTGREGGAHNLYGQTLAETGALGALGLTGLVFCFWRNAREASRFHRSNPDQPRNFASHAARAVGLCVILLLFLGMAGHNLFRFYWIWFAAFQTVALHCLRRRAAVVEAPSWQAAAQPQAA